MSVNKNSIPSPLRILFIEDSEHDATAFNRALDKGGLAAEVTHYFKAEEALEALNSAPLAYDLAVVDYKLPGITGLELCKRILALEIPLPTIIVTGAGTEHIAVEAMKVGVFDYLVKDSQQNYLNILPLLIPEIVSKYRKNTISTIHKKERQAIASISELFLDDRYSLELIYKKLPEIIAAEFDFPISTVMLLAENKKEMVVRGITGNVAPDLLGTVLPMEKTACGTTIASGQPSLQTNIASDPDLHCFMSDSNIETCLSVPVTGKGSGVLGAVILGDTINRFDADIHVPALKVIANHLGQEIERTLADELQVKSQKEWSTALDAYEDGVSILDLDRRLLIANKSFYTMTGSTPKTAIGKFVVDIVHTKEEGLPCPICEAQVALRDGVFIK